MARPSNLQALLLCAAAALLVCSSCVDATRSLRQDAMNQAMPGAETGMAPATNMSMEGSTMAGGSTGTNITFPTWAAGIDAANATGNISILLAAVNATGVGAALNESTAWTILAPNDQAFEAALQQLGLTNTSILEEAQRPLLLRLLSYHVIPSGALNSSSLMPGQNLTTAIEGEPLFVDIMGSIVTFVGATNNATVVQPDVYVGQSVVHIVNAVLVPGGLNQTTNATTGTDASAAGLGGASDTTAMMPPASPPEQGAAGGGEVPGSASTGTTAATGSSPAP